MQRGESYAVFVCLQDLLMWRSPDDQEDGAMIEYKSTAQPTSAGPIPTNHFFVIFTIAIVTRNTIWHKCLFLSGRGNGLQHFLQTPKDTEVAEGGRAVLACQVLVHQDGGTILLFIIIFIATLCQVGDQVGSVQWTRDGLTLGYDRDLPGFDRYSVLGADEAGTYNLQVSHAFRLKISFKKV